MIDSLVARLKAGSNRDVWKQAEYGRLSAAVEPILAGSSSVLDLGCGDGIFTTLIAHDLPSATVVGMDISIEAAWSLRLAEVSYLLGDASRPPFRNGASSVIAKDLLHHMDSPALGVRWITALARETAVIIEANADNPIMSFYTKHNGDQHYTSDRLLDLLRSAAPDVVWELGEATAYPFYLPPIRGLAALWVWPLTGAMMVSFKLVKSGLAARFLGRVLGARRWPPPFLVVTARTSATSGPQP